MTKENLNGGVILMKGTKELVQTKRIRIYQREKLVDKLNFLIPFSYDNHDLTKFTVTLLYVAQDGTIHSEQLVRYSDGQGGYIDYEDAYGNYTHMIYQLPIDSKITQFAGDLTLKLNLQYVDYEGETSSENDNEGAPDPVGTMYVLSTDDTVITVLPVADYYSIVPDESLSQINQKIAELDAKQREIEATAEIYDAAKADNIKLDETEGTLYLTSKDVQIGDKINLNDLGDELTTFTDDGLVHVIL